MPLNFETARLRGVELSIDTPSPHLFDRIVSILTPAVVENLPPHFQNITSRTHAKHWFDRMVSDSRLIAIERKDVNLIIGFLFAYTESNGAAHIGYLLSEDQWGQGFASELLTAFIQRATIEQRWTHLIGGVDKANRASSHLLTKLGFVEQPSPDDAVNFYTYFLPHPE